MELSTFKLDHLHAHRRFVNAIATELAEVLDVLEKVSLNICLENNRMSNGETSSPSAVLSSAIFTRAADDAVRVVSLTPSVPTGFSSTPMPTNSSPLALSSGTSAGLTS